MENIVSQAQKVAETQNKSLSTTNILLWFVGLAYCIAELLFNVGLLEIFSTKNVSIESIERIETIGKVLASFGLSFFIARFLPKRAAAIFFVASFPLFYMSINWSYSQAIDSLSPEVKYTGYYLGAYRALVLDGSIENSTIWSANTQPTSTQKTLMAHIPVVTAQGIDAGKVVTDWIFKGVNNEASKTVSTDKLAEELANSYAKLNSALEPYWLKYKLGSRERTQRVNSFSIYGHKFNEGPTKQMIDRYADKRFMKASGGIPPGLERDEFFQEVLKRNEKLKQFQEMTIIKKNEKLGIEELKVSAIPPFSSKEKVSQIVNDHISKAVGSKIGNERSKFANVEHFKNSKRIITAAYIPSISLILSLVSFILNSALLLATLISGAIALLVRSNLVKPIVFTVVSAFTFSVLAQTVADHESEGQAGIVLEALPGKFGIKGSMWAASIKLQIELLDKYPRLGSFANSFVVTETNSKPEQIKFEQVDTNVNVDFNKDMESLDESAISELEANAPAVDKEVYIDEKKLDANPSYYGERVVKRNPYLK